MTSARIQIKFSCCYLTFHLFITFSLIYYTFYFRHHHLTIVSNRIHCFAYTEAQIDEWHLAIFFIISFFSRFMCVIYLLFTIYFQLCYLPICRFLFSLTLFLSYFLVTVHKGSLLFSKYALLKM